MLADSSDDSARLFDGRPPVVMSACRNIPPTLLYLLRLVLLPRPQSNGYSTYDRGAD